MSIVNGTTYKDQTDPQIITILEELRASREFCHVHVGDVKTGRDWLEESETRGTIGRSCGQTKIPLMIVGNSIGGCGILDHCIIKIRVKRRGVWKTLYRHPQYHTGIITTRLEPGAHPFQVCRDGALHAGFKTERARSLYLTKLCLTVSEV